MKKDYAKYLLAETRKNYNLTAEGYDRTRSFLAKDLKLLASYSKKGEKVLDSGCANGRLFQFFKGKGVNYLGIDFSEELINIAQKKEPEASFKVVNALNLPFPDNSFDKVYSISVLHNIPSKEFRSQYLKESKRVLKVNGLLILRVWDFWQRKEGWRLFFKYTFLKLFAFSQLDFFDFFIPWKDSQGKVLAQRYFHSFRKGSLVNLIKESGFKIKKVWREGKSIRANIYIIAEKEN